MNKKLPDAQANTDILHNQHDVDTLLAACNRLLAQIQALGARPTIETIKIRSEVFAVARILVLKGICTEAEMQAEVYTNMREILSAVLQNVEEDALRRQQQQQQQAAQIQPVRGPGLIGPDGRPMVKRVD